MIVVILISLAITVVSIIMWWKIFAKTGNSGALALLTLIPIGGLVILIFLAVSKWPILQELEYRRNAMGGYNPNGPMPPYPPQGY